MSHRQAYFDSSEPLAASASLGPEALAALGGLYAGEDAFRVDAVEGLGMVASRTTGGFTHLVVGPFDDLLGIELWDATHWRSAGEELEELTTFEAAPPGLDVDAPAAALLEAVLTGDPVVLIEPDEPRRAALIAWISFALPRAEAERLTFTTFSPRPTGARLTATTAEHAAEFDGLVIDASTPATPGLYTRIALELARRGTLADATRGLDEVDPLALAIAGGATDLITPEDLPRTLELITALAAGGDLATAARAAAAIPDGTAPAVGEGVVAGREEAPAGDEPVSLRELEAALDPPEAPVAEWITLEELEASLESDEEAMSLRELEDSLQRDDEDEPPGARSPSS